MQEIAKKIKKVSKSLMAISEGERTLALKNIANTLIKNSDVIIEENKKDLAIAKENKLDEAMMDRLKLTSERIKSMAQGCLDIADYPQVIGSIEEERVKDNGIVIQKERIPLGVILMIFESRPNVVVDSSALAIKSGNAIILKGGKEAEFSNRILGKLIHEAIKDFLPTESIYIIDSHDRQAVAKLLELRDEIDLVIPRGGEGLIRYVYEHSKIPVIAHYKGLCHIYIDSEVDNNIVLPIILNAKTQRPGVCNAMETLLYHNEVSKDLMLEVFEKLKSEKVTLIADQKTIEAYPSVHFEKANAESYETEYLSLKLSIKMVESLDKAIGHINQYGSRHTEAILSNNLESINMFKNSIDASAIAVNVSTRFNDGGELGLGAELGISTTKLHAYGPMGAREMTTTRYVLKGEGQIRG